MSSPKKRGNYLLKMGTNTGSYLLKMGTNAKGYLSQKITKAKGYLSKKTTSTVYQNQIIYRQIQTIYVN